MTIAYIIDGADFTNYSRHVRLPYIDEVKAYYLYGTSFAASSVNLALTGSGTITAVGTPTYSDGYAGVSNSAGFDLGYINSIPFTQLVVAQHIGNNCGLSGHFTSSTSAKKDLLSVITGALTGTIEGAAKATLPSSLTPIGSFTLYAHTYDGSTSKVYAHDGSAMQSISGAFTSANVPDANTRIGASTFGGAFNVAASATWQRVLTAAELQEVYDFIKPALALRSVTVL